MSSLLTTLLCSSILSSLEGAINPGVSVPSHWLSYSVSLPGALLVFLLHSLNPASTGRRSVRVGMALFSVAVLVAALHIDRRRLEPLRQRMT